MLYFCRVFSAEEIATRSTDWVLLVLLAIAIFTVIAKLAAADRFAFFTALPFKTKGLAWAKEFNPFFTKRVSDLLLGLSGLLTFILALFFIHRYWSGVRPITQGWVAFLQLFFFTTAIFLVKTLLGSAIAAVFELKEEIAETQNISIAYFSWLLIPLYPLLLITSFANWQHQIMSRLLLAVCLIISLYALWQTAKQVFKLPATLSYNIFYLCTLEISPLITLVFIMQNI